MRLIFLGGLAEVGKNMFLLEYEDDIIVVDCGVGFPQEDQLGIDLVLPDIGYLKKRQKKIRGIFLTHGHEDHIGAIAYHLPELRAPVYGTRLTIGLVKGKLEESGFLPNAELIEFDPDVDEPMTAGVFTLEPFRVCHSIPDAVGFGITTPAGLIVHTGDFKLDPTPIDDKPVDYAKLRAFSERGVRLLISDCVHIESPGSTPSEREVGETYDRLFASTDGRIIIATFASLIARIQQVIDVAEKYGRRVATLGRSLEKNVQMALELGYLTDPTNRLVDGREGSFLPDNEIVFIVTGSQGEPMAVLSRIANGDHRDVIVGPGDTVVVSATPIPGNETSVYRIINNLFKAGAEVIYGSRARVHVSGHASADEIATMLDIVKPRDVVPFHGEHRHTALYRDLAMEQGYEADQIHFGENGQVISITPDKITVEGKIESGNVYVDGITVGAVGDVVIRDRRALARDGILMVIVVVDRDTGQIVAGPDIATRGFVHAKDSSALLDSTKEHLRTEIGDGAHFATSDWGYLSRQLRDLTANYLHKNTKRRPMILPMVMEL
ncbi:ribonuclease J [soil metagenome]